MYVCMYVYIYIYIHILVESFLQTGFVSSCNRKTLATEKGEVLLRGVGTLRYFVPPSASVRWQPGGLTTHTNIWFLGAGFLGAPPISLRSCGTVVRLWYRVESLDPQDEHARSDPPAWYTYAQSPY